MNSRPLQAVATDELIAMRARAHGQLKAACQVSDARQGPRVMAADIAEAFLRYDDELEARGIGG